MPREIEENIDLIRIDLLCDALHIACVVRKITPLRNELLKKRRILIVFAKIIDIDLELTAVESRKERPNEILHDMHAEITGDITDAQLLFPPPPLV